MLSLTYLSSAPTLLDRQQLADLLASFRPRNESLGITGVLLYADGNFIQTLEGPDEVVEATFAKIVLDSRHRGVLVALREQIEERTYPDWSMGFRSLSAEEADSLPGFNEYMNGQRSVDEPGATVGHAEIFHRVFRDGARYTSL